mmetsp:Transcript_12476/g.36250  ORF Transcript_12476/g.36250 Transcript_12476/m.36250 type:complete len:273 (-) Transcript_12476:1607-2425(-)
MSRYLSMRCNRCVRHGFDGGCHKNLVFRMDQIGCPCIPLHRWHLCTLLRLGRLRKDLGIILDLPFGVGLPVKSSLFRPAVHPCVLFANLDMNSQFFGDRAPVDFLVVFLGDGIVLRPQILGVSDDRVQIACRRDDDRRSLPFRRIGRFACHRTCSLGDERRVGGRLRSHGPSRNFDGDSVGCHQFRTASQCGVLLLLRKLLTLFSHFQLLPSFFLPRRFPFHPFRCFLHRDLLRSMALSVVECAQLILLDQCSSFVAARYVDLLSANTMVSV